VWKPKRAFSDKRARDFAVGVQRRLKPVSILFSKKEGRLTYHEASEPNAVDALFLVIA
jgi:hypothetical protein